MLDLTVQARIGWHATPFPLRNLVIAGWAGRNADEVQHHIAELAAIGVAAPTETPMFYRVSSDILTVSDTIEVLGSDTSGEVECVLFIGEDDIYVGVGSDHTDRNLESVSVSQSKQVCAKPVSTNVWPMSDLMDHWDELRLESTIGADFETTYQSGPVSGLLSPHELLDLYRQRGGDISPGLLMFCGTLPVVGRIRFASDMELRLVDPVLGREIRYGYRTRVLPIMG